jgi:hypothetical protein
MRMKKEIREELERIEKCQKEIQDSRNRADDAEKGAVMVLALIFLLSFILIFYGLNTIFGTGWACLIIGALILGLYARRL